MNRQSGDLEECGENFAMVFLFLLCFVLLPTIYSRVSGYWNRPAEETVCKQVVINYEVEYDTIYTGNQTSLFHRGAYIPQPTCGAPKRMSAYLFIPHNISLALTFDDGRQAHLLTPFLKILNGEPQGFFRYDGDKDWVKMIIDVKAEEAEDSSVVKVFVKATPATEERWNTDYRRRGRGV